MVMELNGNMLFKSLILNLSIEHHTIKGDVVWLEGVKVFIWYPNHLWETT